jgi:hypothetical protein
LPDVFSNQKSQFGQILDGLKLENVIYIYFFGHLEYFGFHSGFGILHQEKSDNPG